MGVWGIVWLPSIHILSFYCPPVDPIQASYQPPQIEEATANTATRTDTKMLAALFALVSHQRAVCIWALWWLTWLRHTSTDTVYLLLAKNNAALVFNSYMMR